MHNKYERKLALFDLDGTLTKKDTLFEIIQYFFGKRYFYFGLLRLAPILISVKLKIYPNSKAKEKLLSYYFGGMSYDAFQKKCTQFAKEKLPLLLRDTAIGTLRQLRDDGTYVIVVSASIETWIAPWCNDEGISCISTQLEVSNGFITGKLASKNCNGIEKVNRIKDAVDLSKYDTILAYGDSKGDLPMLKLADKPHYRFFQS